MGTNANVKDPASQGWSLYIDDERDPKTSRPFSVVRSVEEAKALIRKRGCPAYISFDHDLGSDNGEPAPNGYDLAKWLIACVLDGEIVLPDDFSFNVHSANPVGKANIEGILSSFLSTRQN